MLPVATDTIMRKVIIFGAGARTEGIINTIKPDISIVAIVDNDENKWGISICGVNVYAPDHISNIDYDFIFIVPYNHYQIQRQLENAGIAKECIINSTHIEAICNEMPIEHYIADKHGEGKTVVAFSHALSSTGAQNVLMTALFEYRDMGFPVTVISTSDGELREEFLRHGINVLVIRDLYIHKREINQLLESAELTVINTLWLYYVILDICDDCKKSVWWIHESLNIEYIDADIFEKCIDKGVEVYAVSELVRDDISKRCSDELQMKILRFGIPEYRIRLQAHDKMNFVVLAAMAYIKGQDLLIEAVGQLPDDIRNRAEFYLVGGGHRTEKLLASAKKAGVHILDAVPHNAVANVYEMADVIVCPSRKEAMSVSIAEAMMHRKAIIVSDAAGIAYYIKNGENGLLFESGNSKDLSRAIEWMILNEDKSDSLGKAARDVYDRFFKMEIHRCNLEKLLQMQG